MEERMNRKIKAKHGMQALISLLMAFAVSGILMAVCGYQPFLIFGAILHGAFGSKSAIVQTLIQSTPLIFSGLAYIFAARAGMFNLGMEGQIYMGGIAAAAIGGMDLGVPAPVHIGLTLCAGMIAGGLFGALAGVMKACFGANEVISTLMLNFVAINFTSYLVNYPLKAPGPVAQTQNVMPSALLPKLSAHSQLSAAILLAVFTALAVKYFLGRTAKGFDVTVTGSNQKAAQTAGIRIRRILILAMFVSGAIAGIGGACHITGVDRRFVDGFSAGYGFDGIAVAALASNRPLMVLVSSIIFGALRAGALRLNMTTNLPTDFISVIQALVVIFVAAPMFVEDLKRSVYKLAGRTAGRRKEAKER
ncbi:ABC transporter permease [Lachnospiraceae bacterium ASD4241]|uniref:ABC transporter permease n=2 Tax=Diplocloster modestus TaxID=2850322 RepID=A0ABS6KE49_9FIRM|nr:ABC transporter permease [Diplocloster modestus]